MKSSFWLPIVLLFSTFRRNESILFILFNKNERSSLPSAPVSAAGVSFARPSHFVDMRGARRSLRDSKHAKVTTRSRYRYEACAGVVASGAAYLSTRTLRPHSDACAQEGPLLPLSQPGTVRYRNERRFPQVRSNVFGNVPLSKQLHVQIICSLGPLFLDLNSLLGRSSRSHGVEPGCLAAAHAAVGARLSRNGLRRQVAGNQAGLAIELARYPWHRCTEAKDSMRARESKLQRLLTGRRTPSSATFAGCQVRAVHGPRRHHARQARRDRPQRRHD